MPRKAPKNDRDKLRDELTAVAKRGLHKVFLEPSDHELFKVFARIVRKVQGEDRWASEPTAAAKAVITSAVMRLPETKPNGDNGLWESKLTWQEIGRILFRLPSRVKPPYMNEKGTDFTYSNLVQFVYEECGIVDLGESKCRKQITMPLRDKLRDIMLDLEQGQPEPLDGELYIARPEIEFEYSKLTAERHKVIVFVGQPGMGKTTLAKALVRNPDGTKVPRIRFNAGSANQHDLSTALQSSGIEMDTSDTAACLVALLRGSQKRMAAPVVFIDNLDSADDLARMLPDEFHSHVVATCRIRGHQKHGKYQFIDVNRMSVQQATQMVVASVADLNEDDALLLAQSLGGYPLIIKHACDLILVGEMTIEDLCADLRLGHGAEISQMWTEDSETLLAILGRVTRLVKQADPLASTILEMIALILLASPLSAELGYVDRQVILAYLDANANDPITVTRFELAIDALKRHGLVAAYRQTDHYGDVIMRLSIVHPLTWQVLVRIIFAENGDGAVDDRLVSGAARTYEWVRVTYSHLYQALERLQNSEWQDFSPEDNYDITIASVVEDWWHHMQSLWTGRVEVLLTHEERLEDIGRCRLLRTMWIESEEPDRRRRIASVLPSNLTQGIDPLSPYLGVPLPIPAN